MFVDGSLHSPGVRNERAVPLATIHEAVLEFLGANRNDAALFGAQAVNAYVDEPRMTPGCEHSFHSRQ